MGGPTKRVMSHSFEELLASSVKEHGHLCAGQVVGVRMAMLGARLLGLEVPCHTSDLKKLIVFVEMDRCTADAVAHTIGVKLGRRSLKFQDYGIMAATFHNLETGQSFRIISTEESRDLAEEYAPEVAGKVARQIAAYKRMPEKVLFSVQRVHVELNELDLPGPTRKKVVCQACGQVVRDGKERRLDGKILCRPCAGEAYFSQPRETAWPGMEGAPEAAGVEAGMRLPMAENGAKV